MSVTISRFVQVMSGGRVVSNTIVSKLDTKLTDRLQMMQIYVRDFEKKVPQALELRDQLKSLEDMQAKAAQATDNSAKSDLLEKANSAAKKYIDAARVLDQGTEADLLASLARYNLTPRIAVLEPLIPRIPDGFLRKIGAKKLADFKSRRGAAADKGDPGDEVTALMDEVESAIRWSEAAIQFGTGTSKNDRDVARLGAQLYRREGRKLMKSKDAEKQKQGKELVELAKELREQRKAIEKIAERSPMDALKSPWGPMRQAYTKAAALYKKAVLAPGLTKKVAQLIADDPDGSEAKMQEALGADVFEERLLSVYNIAKASGSPDIELLSPGEAVAIFSYTGSDYIKMNTLLRTGTIEGDDKVKEATLVKIEQAVKAMAKLPVHPVTPSTRGERAWPPDDAVQYTVGNEFAVKTFWSTGVGFDFGGPWRITVHGKSGRNVAPLSNAPGECEVLFAPGTRFRVKSVTGLKVVVEEI